METPEKLHFLHTKSQEKAQRNPIKVMKNITLLTF